MSYADRPIRLRALATGASAILFAGFALAWTDAEATPEQAVTVPRGSAPASSATLRGAPERSDRATLVVFITVDQLRGDYIARFGPRLTGGLRRLFEGGALYVNAHQDHAVTETAPGHASTMSGRFPRSTGIAFNIAGVSDSASPLIGSPGIGASPHRFRGTVLADWMIAADTGTRVLSVSRKDRGAILPVGRGKHHVYWYAADGRFTTSRYYRDTLPSWVQSVNARRVPQSMAGRQWEILRADSAYPEPDLVPAEGAGWPSVFPHALPPDTLRAGLLFPEFPWMDELTLDLALEGVRAMELGRAGPTDLLAISLSATDAIGHRFGPDSRELSDQILRLDDMLGRFLDSLYQIRDSSTVIVALTADHGVAPLPEVRSRDRNRGARRVDLRPFVTEVRGHLRAAGIDTMAFSVLEGAVIVQRERFPGKLDADSLVRAFLADARRMPGVQRADLLSRLARADTVRDAVARRWLHMFDPGGAVAAVVTLAPYSVWASFPGAQHGSPNAYDTHVPVVFYGAPFRAGRYTRFVRVVDMAPTLAAALGIRPAERLDGRVLRQ